jgi:hypothetical protein
MISVQTLDCGWRLDCILNTPPCHPSTVIETLHTVRHPTTTVRTPRPQIILGNPNLSLAVAVAVEGTRCPER